MNGFEERPCAGDGSGMFKIVKRPYGWDKNETTGILEFLLEKCYNSLQRGIL